MRSYLIWASLLLFLVSCALPVVTFHDTRDANNSETWYGWGALFLGWLGPHANNYAWFANLFWIVGSLFLGKPGKTAPALLGIAVLLALTMFLLPGTIVDWDGSRMKKQASGLHYGAYVWLGAMIAQFCAGWR